MQPSTHREVAKNLFFEPLTGEELDLLKISSDHSIPLSSILKQIFLYTLKKAPLSSRRFHSKAQKPALKSELHYLTISFVHKYNHQEKFCIFLKN